MSELTVEVDATALPWRPDLHHRLNLDEEYAFPVRNMGMGSMSASVWRRFTSPQRRHELILLHIPGITYISLS